jgi:hypothetical protein
LEYDQGNFWCLSFNKESYVGIWCAYILVNLRAKCNVRTPAHTNTKHNDRMYVDTKKPLFVGSFKHRQNQTTGPVLFRYFCLLYSPGDCPPSIKVKLLLPFYDSLFCYSVWAFGDFFDPPGAVCTGILSASCVREREVPSCVMTILP